MAICGSDLLWLCLYFFYHHLDDIIMIENFFIVSFFSQCVAEHIPMLVQGVRDSIAQPDNPGAQLNLINVSQNFVQVMITLCSKEL